MEVKYKIDRIRLKVRMSKYVSSDLASSWETTLTEEDADEIDQYVKEHNLGRRVAWDMWQFKNKESLTLFMLRYG